MVSMTLPGSLRAVKRHVMLKPTLPHWSETSIAVVCREPEDSSLPAGCSLFRWRAGTGAPRGCKGVSHSGRVQSVRAARDAWGRDGVQRWWRRREAAVRAGCSRERGPGSGGASPAGTTPGAGTRRGRRRGQSRGRSRSGWRAQKAAQWPEARTARRVATAWAPARVQRIPAPFSRASIRVLQRLSTAPEPMGSCAAT